MSSHSNTSSAKGSFAKPQDVEEMFNRISGPYDFFNRLFSMGIDTLWRAKLAQMVKATGANDVLDLACGTGDVCIALEKKDLHVIGLDFAREMLMSSCKKEFARVVRGDAMNQPFSDNTFDAVTVGFGIRNFPDYSEAMKETLRVLKPGGRFFILEFSQVNPLVRIPYQCYLGYVMPWISGILSGERSAYSYLSKTVNKFPSLEELTNKLERAGYEDVQAHRLFLGVAAIHSARKPSSS